MTKTGSPLSVLRAAVSTLCVSFALQNCGEGGSITSSYSDRRTSAPLRQQSAELRQLTISPMAAELAPGATLSLKVMRLRSDGTSDSSLIGVSFSISDPELLADLGSGQFKALRTGKAKITAQFSGKQVVADVTIALAGCDAFASFNSNIVPIMNEACQQCHGPSGSDGAKLRFGLSDDPKQSWLATKAKLDLKSPQDSLLLNKLTGKTPHGGGAIIGATDARYEQLLTWSKAEAECLNAGIAKSLAIIPSEISLEVKSPVELQVHATYVDGSVLPLKAGIKWTLEKESGEPLPNTVATIDANGKLSAGDSPAKFRVIATVGEVKATSLVTINLAPTVTDSENTCPSFANFRKNIAPIFGTNCSACHGGSGPGQGAFPVAFTSSRSDCSAAALTWKASLTEINYQVIMQSALYRKPAGLISHGGGLALTDGQLSTLKTWLTEEASCKVSKNQGYDRPIAELCAIKLTAMTIAIPTSTINVNETLTPTIKVTYDDGSTGPSPAGVTWVSENPATVTVGTDGLIRGLTSGTAKITAKLGNLSASVLISVRSASITVIRYDLSPASQTVAKGQTATYSLIAKYSDGSTAQIKSGVIWSVSDSTVASVSTSGTATGLIVSSTIVKASPANCGSALNCPATAILQVKPEELTSLSVTPTQSILTVGTGTILQVNGHYSDLTTKLMPTTTWSTDDTTVIAVDQNGKISARAPGDGKVNASTGGYTVSAPVLVIPNEGCSTVQQYQQSVDPILQISCVGCHGNGGQGSASFLIKGPSPEVHEIHANWMSARARVDGTNIEQSKILTMAANAGSLHPGGQILAPTGAEYITLKNWVAAENSCLKVNVATNLTRSSGEVIYLRLSKLFPSASSTDLSADAFDLQEAAGLDRILAHPDRMWSPVSDISLRKKANALCSNYIESTGVKSTMFKLGSDSLFAGESAPTDPLMQEILAVARNTWLYPYLPNDPEVSDLRELYNGVLAIAQADSIKAKKIVCVAALMAPQFLFGNGGDADAVRRISLEVGRTLPSMADFEAYKNATNKPAYLKTLTANLQSAKTGYANALRNWHRAWLGLRDFIGIAAESNPSGLSREISSAYSASAMGGTPFTPMPPVDIGFATRGMELGKPFVKNQISDLSEICAPGLEQEFDPRTIKILWEHKNPVTSAWESIGYWEKAANGTWSKQPGSITLTDGSKLATTVDDITPVTFSKNGRNYYSKGKLVGTPVDGFIGERNLAMKVNKTLSERRVRRFSPTGEQNGFSKVKLWYSGETVYMCNTTSRFVATCGYRSAAANRPGVVKATNWNAGSGGTAPIVGGGLRDSYLTPPVIDAMSCGLPDLSQLANVGTIGYQESKAWPKGGSLADNSIDPASINTVAINVLDTLASYSRLKTKTLVKNNAASTYPEHQALSRLIDDITQEPLRLIEDTVLNSKDYRLVLTAPYTFVRSELDLYYRTQAYYLPLYPTGTGVIDGGGSVHRLDQVDISNMPLSWITQSYGGPNNSYNADERAAKTVTPRVMSGILTQAQFLGPVSINAGKIRSISARVFERLLCGLPSDFLPMLDANAQMAQEKQVPIKETGGAQHLDKSKGCYSCHISLDPMSSALNANFANSPSAAATGDLKYASVFGISNLYGIRGSSSKGEGFLFGEKVSGVKDLATALADSAPFTQCVVKKAFTNVFGRDPVGSDLTLISNLASDFGPKLKHDYNTLIQALVSSPEYVRSN